VQETGVGKTVNGYRKHSCEPIANCSRALVSKWKQLVHTAATGDSLETETNDLNDKQLGNLEVEKAEESLADQCGMKQNSFVDHPLLSVQNGTVDKLKDSNTTNESHLSSQVTSVKSSRRSAVSSSNVDGKKETCSDSLRQNNKDSSQSAGKSSKNYHHSSTSQSSHSHSPSTNSHNSGKNSKSATSSDSGSKYNISSKRHESSSQWEKNREGHAMSSKIRYDAENSSSKQVITDDLSKSGSDDCKKRSRHSEPSVSATKLKAEKKDSSQALPSDSQNFEKYQASKSAKEKTTSHDSIQHKVQSGDRMSSSRGTGVDSPSVKRARFEVSPGDSDKEADEDNNGLSFEEMLNYDAHVQSRKRKAQGLKNDQSTLVSHSEKNSKGLANSSNRDTLQHKKHSASKSTVGKTSSSGNKSDDHDFSHQAESPLSRRQLAANTEKGIHYPLVPQPSTKV
jgi:hypothetical protein